MNRQVIALLYLRTWFPLDLLTSFPFTWITDGFFRQESTGSHEESSSLHFASGMLPLLKVLRFLRLFKIVRLAKLSRITTALEDWVSSYTLSSALSLAKMGLAVFFIIHWSACMWYFISDSQSASHPLTWLYSSGIGDSNLLVKDGGLGEKYIAALYWAITTVSTVGYGDIVPVTTGEKVYTCFIMALACGVFAFVIASVSSQLSSYSKEAATYRHKTNRVMSYLKAKNVPVTLRVKVKRYLEYKWSQHKAHVNHQFMSHLSEPLRAQITMHIYGRVVVSYELFRRFDEAFIVSLTKQLQFEFYSPQDVIFEQGQVADKLFFVKSGTVDLYENLSRITFSLVKGPAYFGEIGFLLGEVRCLSARTSEVTEAMSITRLDFTASLECFPSVSTVLRKTLKSCMGGNLTSLGVVCFYCKVRGHVALNCPNLQFGFGEGKV
jgi:hyperpolarization activated cyclic nucleotide-gated potassium channel 2